MRATCPYRLISFLRNFSIFSNLKTIFANYNLLLLQIFPKQTQ